MASTWAGSLTFGRVITNPGGGGPSASRKTSSVRMARRRTGPSSDLQRRPTKGGRSPLASAVAVARACASSSSSGRTPYPSSKSMRRSSTGSVASLVSTRSLTSSENGSGPCSFTWDSTIRLYSRSTPRPYRSAGTYSVCTGCRVAGSPG